MQDVNDLMQRLIDVWAAVEESVNQDDTDHLHSATGGYYEYSLWQKIILDV